MGQSWTFSVNKSYYDYHPLFRIVSSWPKLLEIIFRDRNIAENSQSTIHITSVNRYLNKSKYNNDNTREHANMMLMPVTRIAAELEENKHNL